MTIDRYNSDAMVDNHHQVWVEDNQYINQIFHITPSRTDYNQVKIELPPISQVMKVDLFWVYLLTIDGRILFVCNHQIRYLELSIPAITAFLRANHRGHSYLLTEDGAVYQANSDFEYPILISQDVRFIGVLISSPLLIHSNGKVSWKDSTLTLNSSVRLFDRDTAILEDNSMIVFAVTDESTLKIIEVKCGLDNIIDVASIDSSIIVRNDDRQFTHILKENQVEPFVMLSSPRVLSCQVTPIMTWNDRIIPRRSIVIDGYIYIEDVDGIIHYRNDGRSKLDLPFILSGHDGL